MNLNFSVEEFLEGIEQAKRLIPKKPTIVVKNATVTGVKLNSKIIDSIPRSKEPIPFYKGINVYKDDSLDKPRFIVEGEIEKKNYLKWEDIEFGNKAYDIKVKLGVNIYILGIGLGYINHIAVLHAVDEKTYFKDIHFTEQDKQFFNDLLLEVVE